ncbi:MAG: FCD domain-containing protein [Candidatus Dormiibacterota bacterium]
MISRVALVDQVIDSLRHQIASGQLPLGARLPPEPELMRQLGIGRSTLREAVSVLAHGGVLEVRQGDGSYVRSTGEGEPLARRLRRAELADVVEVRRLIEVGAARLAAARRTESDLGTIRAAVRQRRESRGGPDFVDVDLAFHRAVVDAAANPVLRDLFASFSDALRRTIATMVDDPDLTGDTQDLHEAVYEAIAAGDAVTAGERTAALFDDQARRLGR